MTLPLRTSGRSRLWKKLLAATIAAVLTGAPIDTASAAPADRSEALAQVVESKLLKTQLLEAASSLRGLPPSRVSTCLQSNSRLCVP